MPQVIPKPKKRSTYNAQNALQFKRVFDDAIHSRTDTLVKVPPGRSALAFRQKCSDALLWLLQNNDYEHPDHKGRIHHEGDYAKFRGQMKMMFSTGDEVQLKFIANGIQLQTRTLDQGLVIGGVWKEKIHEFLDTPGNEGTPFRLEGLYLKPEEITYCEGVFTEWTKISGTIVHFDVTVDKVFAIKQPK